MTGHVWQWTRSSYDPYPGFRPLAGAVSEYNGKFMVGQLVLRGGSAATPAGHTRPTYRNFFRPPRAGSFRGFAWRGMPHADPQPHQHRVRPRSRRQPAAAKTKRSMETSRWT